MTESISPLTKLRNSATLSMVPLCRMLRCRYLLVCCIATLVIFAVVFNAPPVPSSLSADEAAIQFNLADAVPVDAVNSPFSSNSNKVATSTIQKRQQPPETTKKSSSKTTSVVANKNATVTTTVRNVSTSTSKNVSEKSSAATPEVAVTPATAAPPQTGEVFLDSKLHSPSENYVEAANGSLLKLPVIYVVTPTYKRLEQPAELTRLSQTLMHVPSLHWIVVEDASAFSDSVRNLLHRSGLNFTHLLGPKPARFAKTQKPVVVSTKTGKKKKKSPALPRGVSNRLAALDWVRKNVKDGVLYFGDDDNSYDIRLFEEMRWTKKVSMWPVGLVTQLAVSSPVVKNSKVVGFYDGWVASRKFPVDMAGFAVNIDFMLQKPNVTMPFKVGYEEDGFLLSLNITMNDIEPRANNCTEVLVWHTKTVTNKPPTKMNKKDNDKYQNTNILKLHQTVA